MKDIFTCTASFMSITTINVINNLKKNSLVWNLYIKKKTIKRYFIYLRDLCREISLS